MQNTRRQFIQAALAPAAASALTPWSAFAQGALPLELVKIVNGFPAGGSADVTSRRVGDKMVPMPHLGLVLELADWQPLAERLKAAGVDFVMEPQVRFEGQPGEQWTMFFCDPSGNPIEVKGFRSLDTLYAT